MRRVLGCVGFSVSAKVGCGMARLDTVELSVGGLRCKDSDAV